MIGKLLHIANSYPSAIDKERFYAMKSRILQRWGTPDGRDIQHIEGKQCWTCYGSGIYVGIYWISGDEWQDTCNRCFGSGWFKSPVWVVLERYRIGNFVFHQPTDRLYKAPESLEPTNQIEGYIEHRDYGWRKPIWAAIVLGLIFDWKLAWLGLKGEANSTRIVQRWHRWKRDRKRRQIERDMASRSSSDFDDTEVPF